MRAIVLAAAFALTSPEPAAAHNGSLDGQGCHHNAARNVYECHQGPLQGQTFKSKAEADARIAADAHAARSKKNTPAEQMAKTPGSTRR